MTSVSLMTLNIFYCEDGKLYRHIWWRISPIKANKSSQYSRCLFDQRLANAMRYSRSPLSSLCISLKIWPVCESPLKQQNKHTNTEHEPPHLAQLHQTLCYPSHPIQKDLHCRRSTEKTHSKEPISHTTTFFAPCWFCFGSSANSARYERLENMLISQFTKEQYYTCYIFALETNKGWESVVIYVLCILRNC